MQIAFRIYSDFRFTFCLTRLANPHIFSGRGEIDRHGKSVGWRLMNEEITRL